ncbi:winged helix-turn-helix transcriptional regulator [Psychromarinibacter sp. S121]|uniref:winged helix-turn-helix transcriptional regulator n=1 Tax=Psychromarinibacter sp. S121 TaxID=3415127 RepID=UPI003C797525
MDIEILVKLTARAWALNILACLDAGTPGRQAPLLAATGASRTAFAQSLSHLIELKLLERNPGHGHPLRPEFRLTPEGIRIAAIAGRIVGAGSRDEDAALLRRTWTVPILVACQRPRYFGEIRADLSPITDRALSLSLKQLQAHRWLDRHTDTEQHPPRPRYHAANAGQVIGRALAAVG